MAPNAPALELLPAVDVQDGQAVRLVQGEAGSATSYGDPVTAALDWQRAGWRPKAVRTLEKIASAADPKAA